MRIIKLSTKTHLKFYLKNDKRKLLLPHDTRRIENSCCSKEKLGIGKVMRDSYDRFFSKFKISKEEFFNFGINETIFAPKEKAKNFWEELKQRIINNKTVYIRGFGRNSNGSPLYQEFYKKVFQNTEVMIDKTNNKEPTTVIENLTGYSKKSIKTNYGQIQNYQVSHIFGKTKNIYAFTAPWNIVYLPKVIDPFTGHEAKGDFVNEYKEIFLRESYSYFKPLIEDYNKIITDKDLIKNIDDYLVDFSNCKDHKQVDIDKFIRSVREELTPISIS